MIGTRAFVRIGSLLQIDLGHRLGVAPEDCDAIIGNLGHESGGFTVYHEIGQPSQLGGVGWAQWTGPRRRKFEAFCATHGFDPHSYQGQFEYLVSEIEPNGPYHGALIATQQAQGLEAKVNAFEARFEAAGVPALASRLRYAQMSAQLRTIKPAPPVPMREIPFWAKFWEYVLSAWL
jgi:hypothetical protein